MKIAIASKGKMITEHFGHCENFNIFDIENCEIIKSTSVPNPGHKPGFLPNFLGDMGVNIIISGSMGNNAIELFNERKIQVITGASGDAKDIVEKYLKGKLVSTNSVCQVHKCHNECSE